MKTINWSGYEWITQERWGDIHPEKTYCWYDEQAVSVDTNNYLHLKTRYKWVKRIIENKLWSLPPKTLTPLTIIKPPIKAKMVQLPRRIQLK